MNAKEAMAKSKALEKLISEAIESATWRGHTLSWERLSLDHALGTCVKCGAWVQCLAKPAPNQIDIGGDAVALDCEA